MFGFFLVSVGNGPIFFLGSKYQKFQVAKMANAAAFQRSTSPLAYWDAAAKFIDGTLVIDAFFDAGNFRLASRFQGLVFESGHGYDRRFAGIQ